MVPLLTPHCVCRFATGLMSRRLGLHAGEAHVDHIDNSLTLSRIDARAFAELCQAGRELLWIQRSLAAALGGGLIVPIHVTEREPAAFQCFDALGNIVSHAQRWRLIGNKTRLGWGELLLTRAFGFRPLLALCRGGVVRSQELGERHEG